jgi:TonB family protein
MVRKYIVLTGLICSALAVLPAASASAATSRPHVDTNGGNMQPAYPATAIPNQESGAVIVAAKVKADGTVDGVAIAKSSGFIDLDNAAANAVSGWKFVPAMNDGQPVDGFTKVQIIFTPPPPAAN